MRFSDASQRGGRRGFKFTLAVLLAWGLIYVDNRLGSATEDLRSTISSWLVKPMRIAAHAPGMMWQTTSTYFQTRAELEQRTRQLEEQLLRVQAERQRLDYIERENDELRVLLEARQRQAPESVVAEVVNTSSLPYINRIVLSKGRQQGVQENQGVFNEQGVIGQLTRVDAETSQARLLTDKRFWVATRIRRNGLLVLLQGDGGRRLRARFLPADADIRDGDVLVTAGGEGPFPSGLPVARIEVTWRPSGEAFMEALAVPQASVRQDSSLLVNADPIDADSNQPQLPLADRSALPANFTPEVLP
ncbi:MAG: rod shape-determining protein MreC [Betaproteobacteria bacterium]|nr:rod shape-determining protein MreC [Betaproteobacteria bacterium]